MHHSKLPLTLFWAAIDGHPFHHLGAATATPTRARLLQAAWLLCASCGAAWWPRRSPLAGLVSQETEIVCRSRTIRTGGGVAAIRANPPRRRRRSRTAGRPRPSSRESPTPADSLHSLLPVTCRGRYRQTDGGRLSRRSWRQHDPHVIGKRAAHIVLPWVHRVLQPQDLGLGRLPRPAPPAFGTTRQFAFRSTDAALATPRSRVARHRRGSGPQLQNVDLTGSKSISFFRNHHKVYLWAFKYLTPAHSIGGLARNTSGSRCADTGFG